MTLIGDACAEDFADADLACPLVSRESGQAEETHIGYEDGDAHGDVHDLRRLLLPFVKPLQRFVKEPGLERRLGVYFFEDRFPTQNFFMPGQY